MQFILPTTLNIQNRLQTIFLRALRNVHEITYASVGTNVSPLHVNQYLIGDFISCTFLSVFVVVRTNNLGLPAYILLRKKLVKLQQNNAKHARRLSVITTLLLHSPY